ncbi:hypothetical protein D3C81_840800 [compost metagenome]
MVGQSGVRLIDVIMIAITALAAAVTLPTFGKEHSVDFGNTSDIVSAMCNIGLVSTAIFAAIKAKNWLESTIHNDAYSLTKELVIDDYTKSLNFINESYNSMFEFSNEMYGFSDINSLKNTDLLKSEFYSIHEFKKNNEIQRKLILLKKIGFKLSEKMEICHCDFQRTVELSLSGHFSFWHLCLKKERIKRGVLDYDEFDAINSELKTLYNEIGELHLQINSDYKNLVDNNLAIMDYIEKI